MPLQQDASAVTTNVVRPVVADQPFNDEGGIPLSNALHSPLREVLRILRRHLLFLVVVMAAISALGTAITLSLTKGYIARATMTVREAANDPMAPADAPTPRLEDGAVDTVAIELKSADLLAKVADAVGYEAEPLLVPLPIQLICKYFKLGAICVPRQPLSLAVRAEHLADHLAIEPVGKSRAISLSFTAPDPDLAAGALNFLMDTEQERERQNNIARLSQTADWLDNRANELRAKWLAAERKISEFRAQSGLTQTTADSGSNSLIGHQLASAAQALSDAQASLAATASRANALHQAVVAGDKRSLLRMTEQPVIASAAIAMNALTIQRAQLSAQFGRSYPEVISLNRRIAQAESDLNAQIGVVMQSINSDLAEKQTQVDLLSRNLERLRLEADVQGNHYGDLSTLQGEADVAKLGYQNFLAHAQTFQDRSRIQQPSLTIISQARVPEKASTPDVPRFILASVLFGLVVAFGGVFALEHLSSGFSEISRIGPALALPLLATTPLVKRRGWLRQRRSLGRYVTDLPRSRAAEAVRSIATRVALADGRPGEARVVAITSASAREGKSLLCLWLASVVATSGRKVLLIDCDFRSGMVSRYLGGHKAAGLAELLKGQATPDEVVQFDPGTKVNFISSQQNSLVADALDVQRLRVTLEAMKAHYSFVILDTPPLLAVSDALIYCSAADQTVFVCRWRGTGRNAIRASVKRLRETRARITGVVVSMVSARQEALYSDTITRRDQFMLRHYFKG